jgi:hypothetical protein
VPEKAWGFESPLPHFAEVANESLGGVDSFSSGKILRQVEGGAIKGGIARMDSRRDFGNLKEYNC